MALKLLSSLCLAAVATALPAASKTAANKVQHRILWHLLCPAPHPEAFHHLPTGQHCILRRGILTRMPELLVRAPLSLLGAPPCCCSCCSCCSCFSRCLFISSISPPPWQDLNCVVLHPQVDRGQHDPVGRGHRHHCELRIRPVRQCLLRNRRVQVLPVSGHPLLLCVLRAACCLLPLLAIAAAAAAAAHAPATALLPGRLAASPS